MSGITRRQFVATGAAAAVVSKPNILVILCDQLNAGVTGLYGGPVPTPNLERIARRGVIFTQATCPTPFCSPTRASLITGLYPHTHGIVHNVMAKDYPAAGPAPATEEGIKQEDVTTEKILAAAGYSTHQYGKWHLSGEDLPYFPDQYGEHREYARELAPVFEKVRSRSREQWMDWYGWALPVSVEPRYREAARALEKMQNRVFREFVGKSGRLELPIYLNFDVRVADKTIERLRSTGRKPFAITCSFNTPHDPNVVPSPYYERFDPDRIELPANREVREQRFEREISRQMVSGPGERQVRELLRIYYASVSLLDGQVGRVLNALEETGKAQDTVVVFTSDHGDMAGGHGMFWKSTSAFYDEVVRVPLLISYPRKFQPGKCEAAAGLTDLAPTLLELAGQAIPAQMQGRSLAKCLSGKVRDGGYSYSERVEANAGRTRRIARDTRASLMARGEGYKYFTYADGEEFLYDLRRDPGETRNLAMNRAQGPVKAEMRAALGRWLRRTDAPLESPF